MEQEDVHLEVGKPAEVAVQAKLKPAEDAVHENVREDVHEEHAWLRLGWG